MTRHRRVIFTIVVALLITAGILLLLHGFPQTVRAAGTLCVAPGGSGCSVAVCGGSCYASVQDAVDAATGVGDEIRVATGVYTGVQSRNSVTQVVYIAKSVTVRGGYSSDLTVWDPDSYPSVLDAQGQGRVIYITGASSPTLEGLTLTGGNATRQTAGCTGESYAIGCGGGISVYNAQPTIVGNVITNNVAADFAEAFPGDYLGYGGGIYMLHADGAVISGNLVLSNTASLVDAGSGGGLRLTHSDALIDSNQILNNRTTTEEGLTTWGGGISVNACEPTIQNNLVQGNWGGGGAGLSHWVAPGPHAISGNRFLENHGWSAVYLGHSAVRFENNQVVDNATDNGVQLVFGVEDGAYTLVNNIIARSGGTSLNADGYGTPLTATLLHNTFVGPGTGHGVYLWRGNTTVFLTNNIVASHTWGIVNLDPASATVTADHTLFWANGQDGITGTNPVFGNPGFIDPSAGDYHIGLGAAIDAGIVTAEVLDIDGDSRPTGQAPDIGADEAALNWVFLPLALNSY
jgi:hypothetical protein